MVQGHATQRWAGRSVSGKVLEEILLRLVWLRYVSLPAACGCVRSACTDPRMSLAATDLQTAAFLCRALHALSSPPQHACGPLTAHAAPLEDLQELYASCGVSFLDLLPKVKSPNTAASPVMLPYEALLIIAADSLVSITLLG